MPARTWLVAKASTSRGVVGIRCGAHCRFAEHRLPSAPRPASRARAAEDGSVGPSQRSSLWVGPRAADISRSASFCISSLSAALRIGACERGVPMGANTNAPDRCCDAIGRSFIVTTRALDHPAERSSLNQLHARARHARCILDLSMLRDVHPEIMKFAAYCTTSLTLACRLVLIEMLDELAHVSTRASEHSAAQGR